MAFSRFGGGSGGDVGYVKRYDPAMRSLVLDIGGVFYRGWPDDAFWPRWTGRIGLSRQEIEDVLSKSSEHRDAQLGRISADEAFHRAGARIGVEGSVMRALAEDAYLAEFNTGFADAVRGLRADGVRVWALTNSLSTEAQLQARPEFAGVFEHVVSSCDVGLAKPDPAIFHALLARLGAAATDVVFVDDLPGHVEVARRLGLEGVLFGTTDQVLSDLAAYFPSTRLSSRL
jgi:HAD superfamily hydrolase (TIGR01509 family)